MLRGVVYCGVQKRCLASYNLVKYSHIYSLYSSSVPHIMPVDPSFIGLAMKAIDKVADSSVGDKALDKVVKEPQMEKNRKKKRSSKDRPSAPRRRSERQARSKRIVANDLKRVDEEPPRHRDSRSSLDSNGPSNVSGFTYSTCGTTVKTDKYQPAVEGA